MKWSEFFVNQDNIWQTLPSIDIQLEIRLVINVQIDNEKTDSEDNNHLFTETPQNRTSTEQQR